jgi:hypothetical protein
MLQQGVADLKIGEKLSQLYDKLDVHELKVALVDK